MIIQAIKKADLKVNVKTKESHKNIMTPEPGRKLIVCTMILQEAPFPSK